MLAELSTLKARLSIAEIEVQFDDLLTNSLLAISARFDKETNRTLARTEDATHEFDATDLKISVPCFPIESVSKFELKTTEAEGWVEQTDIDYLIRQGGLISLHSPLSTFNSQPSTCRVTYTGGYVLPGDPDPQPSSINSQPVRLPPDLEQAAIEQVSAWFMNRDKLGLDTSWPKGGILQRYSKLDLLLPVQRVLKTYERWLP